MRVLSLGAFIIMRLAAYKFMAFKREMPTKAFCKEMRNDVDGLRFMPADARVRLVAETEATERGFGEVG